MPLHAGRRVQHRRVALTQLAQGVDQIEHGGQCEAGVVVLVGALVDPSGEERHPKVGQVGVGLHVDLHLAPRPEWHAPRVRCIADRSELPVAVVQHHRAGSRRVPAVPRLRAPRVADLFHPLADVLEGKVFGSPLRHVPPSQSPCLFAIRIVPERRLRRVESGGDPNLHVDLPTEPTERLSRGEQRHQFILTSSASGPFIRWYR